MGTHYCGTKTEVCALNAFINLVRAADSVSARLHRHVAQADLTTGQFGLLEALWHLGPLHQQELSVKLLCSGGNVTVVVDTLERRGLVRRVRQAPDRRYVKVHLTEKGTRLISALFPKHVKALTKEMGALTTSELETLRRLCRTLGRSECAQAERPSRSAFQGRE